jgi:hypothetical protein
MSCNSLVPEGSITAPGRPHSLVKDWDMTPQHDATRAQHVAPREPECVDTPRTNALFDALWAIAVRLNREEDERAARDKPAAFGTVEDITHA